MVDRHRVRRPTVCSNPFQAGFFKISRVPVVQWIRLGHSLNTVDVMVVLAPLQSEIATPGKPMRNVSSFGWMTTYLSQLKQNN
ncbi:MAG: hypothetical protein ABJ015_02785, partial [Rhodopirellula bahusiensis]